MLELLLGLPMRVWALLALIVVVPLTVALVGVTIARRRTLGIATRLASRAVAIMGVGFGVLALVAVLFVLHTGLQEVRRRHLPAVAELAGIVGPGHSRAPDSVSIVQELALYRAREPDAGPAVAWGVRCRERCLAVVAPTAQLDAARAWGLRALARPPRPGTLHTITLGGELHLVIATALRDETGVPTGRALIAVRAGWVADQALRTAAVLVVLAYVLLGSVWWITRRMIGASVATRVKGIAARISAAHEGGPQHDTPAPDRRDELTLLDHSVHQHIVTSVDQLRAADHRAAEARALAARMEATTTLAAGVAHDFNNLMTGIMANTEVLRPDLVGNPDAMETLATIIDCADRGGRLAQQLLAFARGGRYRPSVVNLNAIVQEILRLEGHAVHSSIEVRAQLAPDLLSVEADPTQLSQVVSNLHRNALEALAGPGIVTVTTRNVQVDGDRPPALAELPSGDYVALIVSDTGPGMSPETRERIFEPFFTTKEGGRGMGLAATYGIVTHHGGQIAVESEPGAGTTFTVYLPATRARAPRAPLSGAPAAVGVTVLFVDDEVSILSATRRLLEASGYRVLTAENGADAIQIAKNARSPIDVILLDLRMPGMSGLDAFDPLTAARPEAKVILCSGYELDDAARALLGRGAADFVQKPFRLEDLTSAIQRALAPR